MPPCAVRHGGATPDSTGRDSSRRFRFETSGCDSLIAATLGYWSEGALLSLLTLAVLAVLLAPPVGAQTGEEPPGFLMKYAGLTQADLSEIAEGSPVSRILDPSVPTEVVPFGAIRVDVPAEFFIDRFRDIADFKKAREVLQIGKFQSPPRIEDLDGLMLGQVELESLKRCRVGDCSLKMTTEMIARLQKEVDWSAPDWRQRAMTTYRRLLYEYAKGYLARGPAALAVYADKPEPLRLEGEVSSLLKASPYIGHYIPELNRHLISPSDEHLPDSEHFLYWSQERFGFKPVVSITDVTIYRVVQGSATSYVVASLQIYADHYFTGSLGLAVFVDRNRQRPGSDTYLIYLNRSRVDLLQGYFSGLKRFFIRRRLLDGMDKYLRQVKNRLEDENRSKSIAFRPPGG